MSHKEENDGFPASAQTGAAVTGLARSLERVPNTGSIRMTNHNKVPARQGSLSLSLSLFKSTTEPMYVGQFLQNYD